MCHRIRSPQRVSRRLIRSVAGEPSEIAAVTVFLLADDASFMTGALVSVNGDQTACI